MAFGWRPQSIAKENNVDLVDLENNVDLVVVVDLVVGRVLHWMGRSSGYLIRFQANVALILSISCPLYSSPLPVDHLLHDYIDAEAEGLGVTFILRT